MVLGFVLMCIALTVRCIDTSVCKNYIYKLTFNYKFFSVTMPQNICVLSDWVISIITKLQKMKIENI